MQINAHWGCTDTVREFTLEADWEKNPLPRLGFEPESVLRLAFQSDALPTELFRPKFSLLLFFCEQLVEKRHPISAYFNKRIKGDPNRRLQLARKKVQIFSIAGIL